jgi:hypothetical protein
MKIPIIIIKFMWKEVPDRMQVPVNLKPPNIADLSTTFGPVLGPWLRDIDYNVDMIVLYVISVFLFALLMIMIAVCVYGSILFIIWLRERNQK